MKKLRGKGADDAHYAEKSNGKQDGLERVAIAPCQRGPLLRCGKIPYGE